MTTSIDTGSRPRIWPSRLAPVAISVLALLLIPAPTLAAGAAEDHEEPTASTAASDPADVEADEGEDEEEDEDEQDEDEGGASTEAQNETAGRAPDRSPSTTTSPSPAPPSTPGTPTGQQPAPVVKLSKLKLTSATIAAVKRGRVPASKIRFSFSLSARAKVRVMLLKQTRTRGRMRWSPTRNSITVTAHAGHNRQSLHGRNRLARGRYRLTLEPAGGAARAVYLNVRR